MVMKIKNIDRIKLMSSSKMAKWMIDELDCEPIRNQGTCPDDPRRAPVLRVCGSCKWYAKELKEAKKWLNSEEMGLSI